MHEDECDRSSGQRCSDKNVGFVSRGPLEAMVIRRRKWPRTVVFGGILLGVRPVQARMPDVPCVFGMMLMMMIKTPLSHDRTLCQVQNTLYKKYFETVIYPQVRKSVFRYNKTNRKHDDTPIFLDYRVHIAPQPPSSKNSNLLYQCLAS